MLQIALRGVKNNPFRYLATSIAIILGVAFFTATGVMTTSFRESFDSSITEAFSDVDAAVRSTDTIDADFFEIRSQIPATTGEELLGIDGVDGVVPYLTGYAQAVTAEGKTVDGSDNAQGIAWIDDADLNPYTVVDGGAPTGPNDIVLDTDTFTDGNFTLGDQVRVLPLPADQTYTLVGTVTSDSDSDFAGQVVGFTYEAAESILGTNDVDQIFIDGNPSISDEQLVANLNAAIGGQGLEAITGQELADEFSDLIGTFANIIDIALKVFAGVALFVGAFVIYNTFSITIAQRTKEMALLRAIGASGRQVSRSVLVEAVIIGIIASAVGAGVGIGLGWLLLELISGFIGGFSMSLTIPPSTMTIGIVIGLVITVVAAWLPARRGARIAPIEALRESAIEEVRAGTTRTIIGLALLGGGLFATLSAAGVLGDGGSATLAGVGIPTIIIAVFLLAPVLVRPVTRVLAIPLVRNGSITGELSRENAARNPKRTATTSLTLMIGVTLMVTATVFAATLSNAVSGRLQDTIEATDVVQISANIAQAGGGLDPTIAPAIQALPDVEAAVPFRSGFAEIDGSFAQVTGVDAAQLPEVLDVGVVDGSVTDLDASWIALFEDEAKDLGVGVGDAIAVKFQQDTVDLTVAGIYSEADVAGAYLTDLSVLEANTPRSLDSQIFVTTNGADGVRAEIDSILASDPTAKVKTSGEFIDDQAGQINTLLYLLYGLLGMSVLVALIGIINTMALSIHERTRELGLLRAVGMNRTQLRRTIRYESALVALMGTALGLILGIFFGWGVQQSAGDDIPDFVLPWSQLAVIVVVGILSGILAGVLPARRAGKLDVLDAIATA